MRRICKVPVSVILIVSLAFGMAAPIALAEYSTYTYDQTDFSGSGFYYERYAGEDHYSAIGVIVPYDITSVINGITEVTVLSQIEDEEGVFPVTEITVGNSTEIWTNLTSITIPASVTYISYNFLSENTKLKNIYYGGTSSAWNTAIFSAYLFNPNSPLVTADTHFNSGSNGNSGTSSTGGSFEKINEYTAGMYQDVSENRWYTDGIRISTEYGIMTGTAPNTFDPDGTITLAQAVAMAVRLKCGYENIDKSFETSGTWYEPYVTFASENGILDGLSSGTPDYKRSATRAEFALLISNSLHDSVLPQINSLSWGDIPDVSSGSPALDAVGALTGAGVISSNLSSSSSYIISTYADSTGNSSPLTASDSSTAIYRLYKAGVLTGNDEYGTYTPNSNIDRKSAATIISRVLESDLRVTLSLTKKEAQIKSLSSFNTKSLQKSASNAQMQEAYDAALKIVKPLANLSKEAQLIGIAVGIRAMFDDGGGQYNDSDAHYNDPYGFFVLRAASCAGCTRATGMCLGMLGFQWEHVNENQWTHQWARVNLNGTYWICDGFGLYCGPEPGEYQHPLV